MAILYKDLVDLMTSLGFRDESVPGSHRAFRHAGSGTLILFSPLSHDEAIVRDEDLVSVRRHLVEKGLVRIRDFDRFLATRARRPGEGIPD